MTLACSALAQKDAAEKVQEGNVNNWIEYYKKQREAPPEATLGAEEEKRGKRKDKTLTCTREGCEAQQDRDNEALPRDAQGGSQK